MKLRPYQEEAKNAILKTWQTHRSHICVAATGAGKTVIAAGVSEPLIKAGKRILYLANRNELCIQPLYAFHALTGVIPDLEKAQSRASRIAPVVVASVQTLSREARLKEWDPKHFDYVFADEAHMSAADSWRRIFTYFSSAKICGITATPFRSDNKDLTDIFETESFRADLFNLVDSGWLVNPDHVDRLATAISLTDVKVKKTAEGYDYDLQESADAIEPYLRSIAKEIKERHSDRKILAFLPLIASSKKFVQICVEEGINAVHIDGEDPFREEKLAVFTDGKVSLLANSNLLHTGIDIPRCDCTLNLRPTRSKVLYAQIVGRSTRTLPGTIDGIETIEGRLSAIAASAKPQAFILDPLWMTNDHDLVTPAFLVAENQADAEEINKHASQSYSLRGVNAQVQAAREEPMRRSFEAAAQFRARCIDANFFASSTHNQALQAYEPVYAWESAHLKKMDRHILLQCGIDPATVTCQGHGRAVIAEVYKRRSQGLAEISTLASLARREGSVRYDLWTLTKEQAREALNK